MSKKRDQKYKGNGEHDWEYILTTLGWLHLDHTLARMAHFVGSLIMLCACGWALTLIIRQWSSAK